MRKFRFGVCFIDLIVLNFYIQMREKRKEVVLRISVHSNMLPQTRTNTVAHAHVRPYIFRVQNPT